MMQKRGWTRHEDEALEFGYCNLYSLIDIAATFKRSISSIRSRAQFLKLKRNRRRYATYNR